MKISGLCKLPDGRDCLWGKLGLALVGRALLSKSLIQFSVDGRGCVPSLLFDLRPNYGGDNEDNGDLLQKVPCRHFKKSHATAKETISKVKRQPSEWEKIIANETTDKG